MLFWKTMAVYGKNHTEYITCRIQHRAWPGTYSNYWWGLERFHCVETRKDLKLESGDLNLIFSGNPSQQDTGLILGWR